MFWSIITILFQTNSWAFDTKMLESLKKLPKGPAMELQSPCMVNLVTPFYQVSKSDKRISYEQCAMDLCGESGSRPSVWVTNESVLKDVNQRTLKEVNKLLPAIEKVVDGAKRKNKLEILQIQKKLKESAGDEFFKSLTPSFKEELSTMFFASFFEEKIDPSAPKEKQFQLKRVKNIPDDPIFKKALDEYADRYVKYRSNDYLTIIEKKLYNDQQLREVLSEQIKNNRADVKKFQAQIPKSTLESIERELGKLEKLDLKTLGRGDLLNQVSNSMFVQMSVSQAIPGTPTSFSTPSCNSTDCQKVLSQYLERLDFDQIAKTMQKDLDSFDLKKEAVNRCKAQLLVDSIKETNEEKAKAIFVKVKGDIKNKTLHLFSEHSRKLLENYLDKELKFKHQAVNLTGEKRPSLLSDFNARSKAYLQDVFEIERDNKYENLNDSEMALKKAIILKESGVFIDPFSDEESPCQSKLTSNAWDAFLPIKFLDKNNLLPKELNHFEKSDQVYVSDFSCNHDSVGKHAVAHEIGHAMNLFFKNNKLSESSLKKYKDLRQCAKENYLKTTGDMAFASPFVQEGDSVYTEEDMADLFAYHTYPDPSENFACSFLKPRLKDKGYLDLDLFLDEGDSHSTPFARTIIEANSKGKLPMSCQNALKEDEPVLSLKGCMK